jgi:integrase
MQLRQIEAEAELNIGLSGCPSGRPQNEHFFGSRRPSVIVLTLPRIVCRPAAKAGNSCVTMRLGGRDTLIPRASFLGIGFLAVNDLGRPHFIRVSKHSSETQIKLLGGMPSSSFTMANFGSSNEIFSRSSSSGCNNLVTTPVFPANGCGRPSGRNMEMGVIRRILKRAKRWHLVGGDVKPLKERRTVGRAMALDEKLKLLRLAASNPDWQTARLAMTLALNTTMRGCELKSLRWRDVDLMGKMLTIRKSKTEAGERVIPLNSIAFAAILELRERAKGFGGLESGHFVFSACENSIIDPTKAQKSWRTSWRHLTSAIECPKCGRIQAPANECRDEECKADIRELKSPTAGLRFHDLRHHAITELAESQASDQTIMAIAGHVSPRMLARYSHVRLEAKKNALDALSRLDPNRHSSQAEARNSAAGQAGYDTSHDTNGNARETVPVELFERNGRHEETRTPDLYRVKVAL